MSLCGDTGVWRRFVHSSPGKFDENRKGKSSSSLPLVSRWGWGGVRSAERARLDRVGGSQWGWVLWMKFGATQSGLGRSSMSRCGPGLSLVDSLMDFCGRLK